MRPKLLLSSCLLMTVTMMVSAQSPYQLEPKKEIIHSVFALTTLGLGIYMNGKTPAYTSLELEALSTNSINAFDRKFINNYAMSSHRISNVLWHGSFGLPLFFLANTTSRKDIGKIGAMWGEALALNAGLTWLTKYSVRRARPYVYNPQAPLEKKMSSNARGSFFSGHTSMTAANTFFVAKVYADYFPDSKWKTLVWTLAASAPAVTGYLRVKAGRHHPTDVLAGYAVGAAIGYLVPHIHKQKEMRTVEGLSLYGSLNGALLRYRF